MKIGIISTDGWLRCWDNYGSLFQNLALQTYLQKEGHETFLIRNTGNRRSFIWRILAFFYRNKNIFAIPEKFRRKKEEKLFEKFNKKHPRYFEDFMSKNLPRTERIFTQNELLENPPFAEVYIVGSDQMWGGLSIATSLDFAPKKALRIAYAVSTAWKTRTEEWYKCAEKLLPKFDAISVREPEGVDVVKKTSFKNPVHVCDPTLLLDKEDYMKFVFAENKDLAFPQKTILAYFLNVKSLDELPWKETLKLSKDYNSALKVIPLQGTELCVPEEYVFTPSPTEWLNAYDKSECVITNSFHGTAFAIIIRKQFLVILQKGKTESENCRFLSILEKLGLESRIYSENNGTMYEQMRIPINWKSVEEKLKNFRNFSMQFLSKSLNIKSSRFYE